MINETLNNIKDINEKVINTIYTKTKINMN